MRVTPKVKLFAWRLAHESIAVKAKLNEKLPQVSSLCPRCQSAPKTPMHAIVFCSEVLQIWNSSSIASTILRDHNLKAWEWWSQFMEDEKSKPNFRIRSAQVTYLLWQIWLAPNALFFEDQRQEPGSLRRYCWRRNTGDIIFSNHLLYEQQLLARWNFFLF
ncbi:hypothetical protein S83_004637 [Arachis hypogaea]